MVKFVDHIFVKGKSVEADIFINPSVVVKVVLTRDSIDIHTVGGEVTSVFAVESNLAAMYNLHRVIESLLYK
jgi:hypothetical protein